MIAFIKKGFDLKPFEQAKPLDQDLIEAIEYCASPERSSAETIAGRTKTIDLIEALGQKYKDDGTCDKWFKGADPVVKQVSATVNGPLMEELARIIDYHDPGVCDLFRTGCPLVRFAYFCNCVGVHCIVGR